MTWRDWALILGALALIWRVVCLELAVRKLVASHGTQLARIHARVEQAGAGMHAVRERLRVRETRSAE